VKIEIEAENKGLPMPETIYSKLSGVTQTNPDGSHRQEIIANLCYQGQPLMLIR
jgi:hypothetical protein